MPRAASARRYAQAIFQIASEGDGPESWLDDLSMLVRALENRNLAEFLDAPHVAAARKADVIKDALGDSIDPLAVNLLSLLGSRNLAHLVPQIAEQFQRLLDSHRGIERAEVASAVALDDAQQSRLEELLRGLTGKEIRLTPRIESGVLGGFVARVGDRVIDGSTRTKLDAMRREFSERRV